MTHVVTDADTAVAQRTGAVPVLATPNVVLLAEHTDEAKRLHTAYIQLLESADTKDEFIARRRELPGA